MPTGSAHVHCCLHDHCRCMARAPHSQVVADGRGTEAPPANTYTMPGDRAAGRRSFALGETATPAGESPPCIGYAKRAENLLDPALRFMSTLGRNASLGC